MPDLTKPHWHKSTRSGPTNNCVEAALLAGDVVAVRDTKQGGAGPVLEFTAAEWIAFLGGAVDGEFDIDSLRLPPTTTLSASPAQSAGSSSAE